MGANRAGSRGGSRWPESRKETSSGLFQWLGVLWGGVQGWWVLGLKLGASIYRQIDGVAVNGVSPVSDYGGAVGWQRD